MVTESARPITMVTVVLSCCHGYCVPLSPVAMVTMVSFPCYHVGRYVPVAAVTPSHTCSHGYNGAQLLLWLLC